MKHSCYECKLWKFRKNQVAGRGKLPATILFICEAPGRSEDLRAKALIGRSGKLLTSAIRHACLIIGDKSPPTYYITNLVQCRPTDEKGGLNRQPSAEEIWACRDNFEAILQKSKAKVIVFLGKVPRTFLSKQFPQAYSLVHPMYILQKGGEASAEFITFVRTLSEALKEGRKLEKTCAGKRSRKIK